MSDPATAAIIAASVISAGSAVAIATRDPVQPALQQAVTRDPTVAQRSTEDRARRRAIASAGRQSTILTSQSGLSGAGTQAGGTALKSILGS